MSAAERITRLTVMYGPGLLVLMAINGLALWAIDSPYTWLFVGAAWILSPIDELWTGIVKSEWPKRATDG